MGRGVGENRRTRCGRVTEEGRLGGGRGWRAASREKGNASRGHPGSGARAGGLSPRGQLVGRGRANEDWGVRAWSGPVRTGATRGSGAGAIWIGNDCDPRGARVWPGTHGRGPVGAIQPGADVARSRGRRATCPGLTAVRVPPKDASGWGVR